MRTHNPRRLSLHEERVPYDGGFNVMNFMFILMCQALVGALEPIAGRYAPRTWWSFPKLETFWASIHHGLWSDARLECQYKFKFAYRMSYESFHALLDIVSPHLPSVGVVGFVREPIASDLALATVLWRLAQGHSTKTVSLLYGVGESTVRKYCAIICRILAHPSMAQRFYISVPSGNRLAKIMEDYQAITGLPQIAGAIDGSHIKLERKPPHKYFPAQYISRHGFASILLQGIVDSKKCFWSVVCKAPGGAHDSTHFKESTLYSQLKRGEVLAQPTLMVQGETIRPYLLADSAYKATTFLVKPFRAKAGQHLREKIAFDKAFSKGRVKVENAFGILKNRWSILQDLNVKITLAPTFVAACCVLHNFVQLRGESEPEDQRDPHPNEEDPLNQRGGNAEHGEMASRVRAALFRYYTLEVAQP